MAIVTVERQPLQPGNNDSEARVPVKGYVDGVETLELLWDATIEDDEAWEVLHGVVLTYMTNEIRRRGLAEV